MCPLRPPLPPRQASSAQLGRPAARAGRVLPGLCRHSAFCLSGSRQRRLLWGAGETLWASEPTPPRRTTSSSLLGPLPLRETTVRAVPEWLPAPFSGVTMCTSTLSVRPVPGRRPHSSVLGPLLGLASPTPKFMRLSSSRSSCFTRCRASGAWGTASLSCAGGAPRLPGRVFLALSAGPVGLCSPQIRLIKPSRRMRPVSSTERSSGVFPTPASRARPSEPHGGHVEEKSLLEILAASLSATHSFPKVVAN